MIKVIRMGVPGLTGKDGLTITVNSISAIDGNITLTATDVGADIEGAADQAEQNANDYTDEVAATKLDAADYVQHFKGKFTSLSSLQESYPTATDGDYAIIDAGTGTNARQYVWDSADGWVDSGEVKSGTTTDQITEGSSNLYFTTSRVRDVVLTGLSLATNAAITATDTVLSAFGKLQKQITDLIPIAKTEYLTVAASDESTALTTGTAKVTFRMPYAMTVSEVRANINTAQVSGSILTVDINENGTSILSTKLTIDNSEKTSTTAANAPVISDSSLADDAEITIDIDQVGDGTAKGLKVTLIGTRA